MKNKKIKIVAHEEWDANKIKDLLIQNDKAVIKGMLALYARQLPEERKYMTATAENGAGFNRIDAPLLTLKSVQAKNQKGLPKKDIAQIRPILLKYSGQLAKIANEKKGIQMEWKL